jgi:AraC family transcriptional regulator
LTDAAPEPVITEERQFKLSGMVYYGDPFHSHEGWSYENEIGRLWQRLMEVCMEHKEALEGLAVDPNISYELHIAPPESEGNEYHIFVGFETKQPVADPVDLFYKVLPPTKYAVYTMKGMEAAKNTEYYYTEWLGTSGYRESYPFLLQRYDMRRFKGIEDPDSEIEYMFPVKEAST